jgi:hypothetical protein
MMSPCAAASVSGAGGADMAVDGAGGGDEAGEAGWRPWMWSVAAWVGQRVSSLR